MKFKNIISYLCVAVVMCFVVSAAVYSGTVTKGKLTKSDIALWAGTSSTEWERETSTGYNLVLPYFDYMGVDVLEVYGGNVNANKATLQSALDAIETTNERLIWMAPTTWDIDDDVTIPSNITMEAPPGCLLQIAAGKTLTINGPFKAGLSQVFSGSGSVAGLNISKPEWFGSDGTSDSTAITSAFNSTSTTGAVVFTSGRTYNIDSTVSIAVSQFSKVMADGAIFSGTLEDVWFELNKDEDASDYEAKKVLFARWVGGKFYNTSVAKSASIALDIFDFRNIKVQDVYFEGFWKAIRFAGMDTFRFVDLHIRNCYYGISLAPWSGYALNTIEVFLENINFELNSQYSGFQVESGAEPWRNITINNCSFNGDCTYAILTDQNSKSYIQSHLTVSNCHFEQGTNSTIYIYMKSHATTGYAVRNVDIRNCSFGTAAANAIDLERAQNVSVKNSYFEQTTGGSGTSIVLDDKCTDISLENVYFSTAKPSYACSRDEIAVLPEVRSIDTIKVDNYDGDSFSDGNATIDMSTDISTIFPSEMIPKGYWMNLAIRDSGSAGANCYVGVAKTSGDWSGTTNRQVAINIEGFTNDEIFRESFYVPCDTNGDIYVIRDATGASTLDIWLNVVGIHM